MRRKVDRPLPKNKKILFITPPGRCGVVEILGRWLPLSFVYLAAAARAAGLDAEIYDARSKDHGEADIEQQLRQSAADYVATTAITATIGDALNLLALVKRVTPQAVTLLGGIHPTHCSEEVLQGAAAVDFVIRGEGEETLGELLRTLEAGGDPAGVAGLAFRYRERVVTTPPRNAGAGPDELPAAWDLLHWPDYGYFVLPGSRLGAICTSRGGGSEPLRYREPQQLATEVFRLHEDYGVTVFLLTDEFAAVDRGRWETFLDLVGRRRLPLYFLMQASAGQIVRDRDIFSKYRRAGIIHIYVAIEPAELERAAGGAPEGELPGRQALAIIHEHGIVSETSFVIGGPRETRAGIERTLQLARRYNPDNAQFLPFTPWPYDADYHELRQYLKVADYARFNLMDPVLEPMAMSLQQVDQALMECYRRFYMGKMMEVLTLKDHFKRDYLLKAMRLMMVNPFILGKLGMGKLGKVPAKIGEFMGRFS